MARACQVSSGMMQKDLLQGKDVDVMTPTSRDEWIAILEAASTVQPDGAGQEWVWLLSQLGLSADYFLPLREAISEGRWRDAKNPKTYLKTVTKKIAAKEKLPSDEAPWMTVTDAIPGAESTADQEQVLSWLDHTASTGEASLGQDGIWRGGGPDYESDDYDDPRSQFESYWDYLVSALPDDLKVVKERSPEVQKMVDHVNSTMDDHHIHLKPLIEPLWEAWGERAGLDQGEIRVFLCKVRGVSRDKALAEEPDEMARKALQAAWKRFQRSGLARLKLVIKNKPGENVPES